LQGPEPRELSSTVHRYRGSVQLEDIFLTLSWIWKVWIGCAFLAPKKGRCVLPAQLFIIV